MDASARLIGIVLLKPAQVERFDFAGAKELRLRLAEQQNLLQGISASRLPAPGLGRALNSRMNKSANGSEGGRIRVLNIVQVKNGG